MNFNFLSLVLIINTLDLVGLTLAKLWSLNRNPAYLGGTIISFAVAAYFVAQAMRFEGMAILNILWISISVILATIVGFFLFKETITPMQFMGMAVIFFGLILMSLK